MSITARTAQTVVSNGIILKTNLLSNPLQQAEEEFNKAQTVFEEINNELREELPVLYQR